jgi:AraC family transcriptional regulator, transcriptional activator of pobA
MLKVKSKPVHYGLYGEDDFLLTDFIHCETIGFRTEMHNLIIEEHIHTSLFQIFILESGELDFSIENTQRLIAGPAIITIPENTLHGMKAEKNVKGKVITISTSFLETLFRHSTQGCLELGSTHIITLFDKVNSFEATRQFTESLYTEMNDDLPEKKLVLQSYFNLLMSLIYRLLKKKSEKLATPDNRNTRYFRFFQKSVKQSYTPMKSIKQYASELNITSVHLNRICQLAVGKSALQIIHEFLVLEAERFLKYTDLHVSEIAYQLNFEDPAYFSRLFRRYTGASPKEFRERN